MVEQSNRKVIPGYEVIRKIGQGGMGAVFLARQISLGRQVAIKLVASQYMNDPISLERFKREAKAAGMVNHKNLVTVYEFGEVKDHPYYVMEYVEGESLSSILERKKTLSEDEAIRIVGEVSDALQHIHEKNMIHRDIKPGNILITKDGTAKLCDMGFVKQTTGDISTTLTMTGEIFGSPAYISPEQLLSKKNIDIRSDIYSLGATLYQMLTGQFPFRGDSLSEIATKRLSEDPIPPKKINTNIRQNTNNLVLKMMARDHNNRHATPSHLLNDLEKLKRGEYIKPPPMSAKKKLAFAGILSGIIAIITIFLLLNSAKNNDAEAKKHYSKGLTFESNGNYKESVRELGEAIKLNPNNDVYYLRRGSVKYKLRDYKGAAEDCTKAISINPRNLTAYIDRGAAKDCIGDRKGEIEDCTKAIEVNPEYALAYYDRGRTRRELGDIKSAIADYDKAISINPTYKEALCNRGAAKYDLCDYKGAIEDFTKVLDIKPNDAKSYYCRGIAKGKLGNIKSAEEDFDKAINIDPNYAEAYRERGSAKYDLHEYQEAVDNYTKAIELNPNLEAAYSGRGTAMFFLGNYQEALKDFEKALTINPNYIQAYKDRSEVKGTHGDVKGALEDLNKFISINTEDPFVYYNRGIMKYTLNDPKGAIEDYDKAISLDNSIAMAYYSRGIAKIAIGEQGSFMQDLQKAKELDPSLTKKVEAALSEKAHESLEFFKKNAQDPTILYSLGEQSRSIGKYVEAILFYEKAIDINPKYIEAYIAKGHAYSELGFYNRAVDDFTKAIEIDPQNKDAYLERGNAKFKVGSRQYLKEAVADWRKAIELDPLWKDWLENQINEAIDKLAEK